MCSQRTVWQTVPADTAITASGKVKGQWTPCHQMCSKARAFQGCHPRQGRWQGGLFRNVNCKDELLFTCGHMRICACLFVVGCCSACTQPAPHAWSPSLFEC